MALSKKPYRGTRDLFPEDKRKLNYMIEVMSQTALSFGYEPYDGPLLEEVELYLAKSGEELINDQIYSFYDRGKRHVAIRPEMTPTVARMVANIHRETPKPIRWFSIPNLMRYEKPQKGRLREHWQFNCDIFGADSIYSEVEIFQVIIKLMKNFGANNTHFKIYINNRIVIDEIFKNVFKLDEESSLRLYKVIDQAKKIPRDKLELKVKEIITDSNAFKSFFDYLECNTFSKLTKFLDDHSLAESSQEFLKLINILTELELIDYIEYDSSIVRGLDYYTGTVFEVFDLNPENKRAISGGGTYSNLLQIFNENPLPGTGFGLGDVTLLDFLEVHKLLPDFSKAEHDLILVPMGEENVAKILKISEKFRDAGWSCLALLSPIKINKAFQLAEKKGAKNICIIGSQEVESGIIKIKSLPSKEEKELKINEIEKLK